MTAQNERRTLLSPVPRQNAIRVRRALYSALGVALYIETGESETREYLPDFATNRYFGEPLANCIFKQCIATWQ